MKVKFIFISLITLVLGGCSSDKEDSSSSFESDINVDDVKFAPTSLKVSKFTENSPTEGYLNFSLEKGTINTDDYESIAFKINYPISTNTPHNPNGVYEFGMGQIGEMLFAQGTYYKGTKFYVLAGYTVKVTALGNNKYRLDFQNIQAVNVNGGQIIIISGYYQGAFKTM